MKRFLFWDGEAIREMDDDDLFNKEVPFGGVIGMPCIDTKWKEPYDRYGRLTEVHGWVPDDVNLFPKEFRLSALVLGVP